MRYLQPKFTVGHVGRSEEPTFPVQLSDIWANDEQRWLMETSPGRYTLWMGEDGVTFLRETQG